MILEFVRLEEAIEVLVLIIMATFIGTQFTSPQSPEGRRAKHLAGATFLIYAGAGINTFGVTSATDLIVIILRASLAAGVVYGFALIVLTPVSLVWKHLKPKSVPRVEKPKPQPVLVPSRKRSAVEIAREAENEARQRKEREDKVNKSRDRVAAFFNQHLEIHGDYPPELLETRLEARFGSVSDKEALAAAEELIGGMKPYIDQARERDRVLKEEEKAKEKEASEQAKELEQIEKRKNAMERLMEWRTTEEQRLRAGLSGPDLEFQLINLARRFDELAKAAIDEAQP